mgnify:CR=1 FL=1
MHIVFIGQRYLILVIIMWCYKCFFFRAISSDTNWHCSLDDDDDLLLLLLIEQKTNASITKQKKSLWKKIISLKRCNNSENQKMISSHHHHQIEWWSNDRLHYIVDLNNLFFRINWWFIGLYPTKKNEQFKLKSLTFKNLPVRKKITN